MFRMLPGCDRKKTLSAFAGFVILLVLLSPLSAWAQNSQGQQDVLFTQEDQVQAFNLTTGLGYQTGTARGRLTGTTFVDFAFVPTGAPTGDLLPFAFNNKVTITDIDGDQIYFENDGTGKFHLGVPGANFVGSGGPLSGTYVVTGGTGKFKSWKVGAKFRYRAIATNPPPNGRLGTVYVEVYER